MTVKKILVQGLTDNPGGIESLFLGYLSAIDRDKYQLDFLANTSTVAFEDKIEAYGSKIYKITPRRKSRSKFYGDLDAFFSAHAAEYDAIWENANSLANIDYLIYAKRFGIPIRIMHGHNSTNSEGLVRGLLHSVNRLRVRNVATHFFSVSDEASVWLYGRDYAKLPNYRVITNTIDAPIFSFSNRDRMVVRKHYGIDDDTVLIGNVGRLHPQKNQKLLLEVLSLFKAEGGKAMVIIVGQGELEAELAARARALGINDQVVFAGALDNVAPVYSAMDLFLFPSLFEGLGIAYLEAQANGLPCLISTGVPRFATVNENVRIVDLKASTREWVDKVSELIKVGRIKYNSIIDSPYNLASQKKLVEGLFSDSEDDMN